MTKKDTDGRISARLDELEARSRDARWWKRLSLALVVGAVSLPLVAGALGPVPHIFSSGEVISATEMNENFAHLQDGITAVEMALPTGTVAFFDLDTCPTGWSAFTGADGRAIVGGPRGTNVGTALSSGGTVSISEVPAHTHAITGGGPVTSSSAGDHVHTASASTTNIAHTHSGTTSSAGGHNHGGTTGSDTHNHAILLENDNGFTGSYARGASNAPGGGASTAPILNNTHSHSIGSAGTAHTHAFTTGSAGGSHSHSVTVATNGAHTHTVDTSGLSAASAGVASVDVTMPYVQLLACRRD